MKRMIRLVVALSIFVFTSPAAADLYKWVDENGVTHWSNTGAVREGEQYDEAGDRTPIRRGHRVQPNRPGIATTRTPARSTISANPIKIVPRDKAERDVRQMVAKDHPNDFSTQAYVLKNNMKAYDTLSRIEVTSGAEAAVLRDAFDSHYPNLSTILYVYKNQMGAKKTLTSGRSGKFASGGNPLKGIPEDEVNQDIFRMVAEDHPENERTQKYVFRRNILAYRKLVQIDPTPTQTAILQEAFEDHYPNIATMLYVYERQMEAKNALGY